jgi:hypothetical protein
MHVCRLHCILPMASHFHGRANGVTSDRAIDEAKALHGRNMVLYALLRYLDEPSCHLLRRERIVTQRNGYAEA